MSAEAMFPKGLSGRHVLIGLVAFFAVVLAVNGVFLYMALSTYTGVVSTEPYRKGLHYNDRIAAEEAQKRLGWRVDVADIDPSGAIRVNVTDATGAALRGLVVAARIGRPSTSSYDSKATLVESAPGVYTGSVPRLDTGSWQLDVEMKAALSDDNYRLRRRLWLKP